VTMTNEVGTKIVSYELLWIRRTRDYIKLNTHYCVLFISSRVMVRIMI